MIKFEDMSRDELIESARGMYDHLLHSANNPFLNTCPFCSGTGVVPGIKVQVKDYLIEEWRKDVTHEENEAYTQKMREMFARK